MILFDNKEKVIKFIICINILLLILLVAKNLFNKEDNDKEYNYVSTSLIKSEGDDTSIYVEYPRFNNNDDINKIVTDLIYNYVKEFKTSEEVKSLDISYKTYYVDNFRHAHRTRPQAEDEQRAPAPVRPAHGFRRFP